MVDARRQLALATMRAWREGARAALLMNSRGCSFTSTQDAMLGVNYESSDDEEELSASTAKVSSAPCLQELR